MNSVNIRKQILECFKDYKGIHSPRFEREMSKLGFNIKCGKKHVTLTYKNCPKKIFLGKTPSDSRAGRNNGHLIARMVTQYLQAI